MSEDAVTRRAILLDLMENYPEITDIDYDAILNTDLNELHEICEKKKIECRMDNAARVIQRRYRDYCFYKFAMQNKIRRNEAARKL